MKLLSKCYRILAVLLAIFNAGSNLALEKTTQKEDYVKPVLATTLSDEKINIPHGLYELTQKAQKMRRTDSKACQEYINHDSTQNLLKREWNKHSSQTLNWVYSDLTGGSLHDEYRVINDKNFPLHYLQSTPNNWEELIVACAKGRKLYLVSNSFIFEDICFNIAKQLNLLDLNTKNQQDILNNIVGKMLKDNLNINEIKTLLESLGYKFNDIAAEEQNLTLKPVNFLEIFADAFDL